MEQTNWIYPAFMFQSRQHPNTFFELAKKHDVSVAYWRVGPTHLYVFQVPWGGSEGGMDEQIYKALIDKNMSGAIASFNLGYADVSEWERLIEDVLHRSSEQSRVLTYSYPAPWMNRHCVCGGAFLCMTGHMLECHYPFSCTTAGCGHLSGYDFTYGQAEQIQLASRSKLLSMARTDCQLCSGSGIMTIRTTPKEFLDSANVLMATDVERVMKDTGHIDAPIEIATLCDCVIEQAIEQVKSGGNHDS